MFKLFLQDSPNDCGAACLASILRHHGLYIPPVELARELAFTRGGTSNQEVQNAAARYGLESRLIELAPDDFHNLTDPCMAYVTSEMEGLVHNVIIYRVRGQKLWVADPGKGKYRTTLAEFSKSFRGLLLIFRPNATFQKGVRARSYLARFFTFIAAYRSRILLSLSVSLVASAFGFGLIYLGKVFIDQVLPTQVTSQVVLFALVYFLARLLNTGITGFNRLFAVIIRNAVARDLGARYFGHVLDLEKRHIDSRDKSDFLQQFNQIEVLTEGVANYFSNFILVVIGILVKTVFLIALYDPLLVSLLVIVLSLNALLGLLFARATAEQANRQSLIFSQIISAIVSAVADTRLVRIFSARTWLMEHFEDLISRWVARARKLAFMEVMGRSLADLLALLSELAIFLVCGLMIIRGTYTIGDFLVFFTFAQGLAAESLLFPQLLLSFQTQLRSYARLQAVLEMPCEYGGEEAVPGEGLEIEFRDVCFSYLPEVPVLQNISFIIGKNETCAFVGESGSGKTTVMNLAMGFYPPTSGSVLVNGRDLTTIDLPAYRRRIAAVFQETTVFNQSLSANLALGQPDLDQAAMRAKAACIGADKLIDKLPMGFRQPLYPGSLSGGQTQLVGILRAVCKPFDLLILDEATSHLDSRTEEAIISGIQELCARGSTRAVIAHRLSTVKQADRIVVMKSGQVVESGQHDELMARKGYYRDLVHRQYEVNLLPADGSG